MKRILVLLTTMVMGVVLASGVALATTVAEQEPNDTRATAQNIDDKFSLDAEAIITDSTTVPHASVDGTGNDTFDYYSFTVPLAGTTSSTFDIDNTEGGSVFGYDSYLRLFDSSGTVLAESDDSAVDPGSTDDSGAGFGTTLDSYLTYTFSTPGTYYIEVGAALGRPVPNTATYRLNVSIPNLTDTTAPTVTSTDPSAKARGVDPAANVTATFSEDMLASSINDAAGASQTFKLLDRKGNQIGATVSYDAASKVATLDPTDDLTAGTTYKAVVTTEARDLAGTQLDQNSSRKGLQQKAWTFTVRR
jgi:hypothetical protein